ncbi:unnamed protein product [Clonostachys rosea]|uniref:F-box domain-containing protein n=1 Tax=Bionectria ochroleuca TaxID=29856 RepID=A0ABY6TW63_BIOOC|nr:unnamed protein product [Clonostachys rosea]
MDTFTQSFNLLDIGPSSRSLEKLPQEILRRTVNHEDLDTQDRKAVSLTCSTLRNHALPSLFRRITISQLHEDLENFLQICYKPHLAQHVREVEWQEISWHPGFFSRAVFSSRNERLMTWLWCWYHAKAGSTTPGLQGMLRAGDECVQLAFDLDKSIRHLFWLFTVPNFSSGDYPTTPKEMRNSRFSQSEIDMMKRKTKSLHGDPTRFDSAAFNSIREGVIAQYRLPLDRALSFLPSLTGVLSRPMNPDRVVWSGGYELKALHFQTQRISWDQEGSPIPTANDGLFRFLFPTIQRHRVQITRLLWQDEYQVYSFLRPLPPLQIFEHLQKLELSFHFPQGATWLSPNSKEKIYINSLLRAATNLTHLVVDTNLRDTIYLPCIRSKRLVSLHLHSAASMADDALLTVLKRNSKTLRHIGLDSAALITGTLNWIKKHVPALRLESCRLTGSSQSDDWVPESHVLDYMNRHKSQDQAGGQRKNRFDWDELLFKRTTIFTEDDLMGAPCWEDSEESEGSDTTEERDYEFSEGSAADYPWSDDSDTDASTGADTYRRRKLEASEVDEGSEAEDMKMDDDCEPGTHEGGTGNELNDIKDSEMQQEDDAGEMEDPAEDIEDEASLKEESEMDADDEYADDEMEQETDADDEEMDIVEDSASIRSSICVEADEQFVYRDIVGSELVVNIEDYGTSGSEYIE